MVIVTGMHRSGTTIAGKLIEASGNYMSIHEPFNKDFGIKDIDFWYPFFSAEDTRNKDSEKLEVQLQGLLNKRLTFKKPFHNEYENFFKKYSRNIIKSKGHLDYLIFKMANFKKKDVLIKDPFLSLCSNYLAAQNNDVKVIYLVRHPVPVYESIKRMRWDFDFGNILQQETLCSEINPDFLTYKSYHEKIANLWCIINSIILKHNSRYSQNTLIISHEELSLNPIVATKKIFSFLGKEMNHGVMNFIYSNMKGEIINPKNNKQHNFQRNSSKLAYEWQKTLSNENREILNLTSDLLNRFNY